MSYINESGLLGRHFRRHGPDIGLIFCVCVPWAANTDSIWAPIDFTIGRNIHYLRFPDGTLRPLTGRHSRRGIPVTYCDGHADVVKPEGVQVFPACVPERPLMWFSQYYLNFWRIAPDMF